MMQNLLENIEKDKYDKNLRVIVLTAEGPVFSAGHNLKELVSRLTSNKKLDINKKREIP